MIENFHKKFGKIESTGPPASRSSKWWLLLLLIPLAGLLYPPFYSTMNPTVGGVPFFIWYQFAGGVWILLALYIPWLDRRAIAAGWVVGIGRSTCQLMQEGFGSALAWLLGWKTSTLIRERDYAEGGTQPESL